MVVCDGQCACTLCDWLNVTFNSRIAVACSKQWHSSQSSRSLNKCWSKHASGERVCLVTAQVNVSSLYFVALVSTHCVIAPNIVLSAIGLPERCVYLHDSIFVANGVSQLHNWSQHVDGYWCKITWSIRFWFDNFLQPRFCSHQNPTHMRTQTRQQRVVCVSQLLH